MIDRDEVARRVLTATLNVDEEDARWLVGHMVIIQGVGEFIVTSAQLDPKLGKTATMIRNLK